MTTDSPFDLAFVSNARTASFESILASFERYGVVKLEDLLPRPYLHDLAVAADRIYRDRDIMAANGSLPAELTAYQARRTISLNDIKLGNNSVADELNVPLFIKLARHYLKKEPAFLSSSFVREMVPGRDHQKLPFHQDETILKQPLLNVWIPLTRCGVTAPGLEVVAVQHPRLLEVDGPAESPIPVERARLSELSIKQLYGAEALWAPTFSPGEALVFAGTTVHRTYSTPGMTERRLSVELRLI